MPRTKPFLIYWAPEAQLAWSRTTFFKEWADKYKGKFSEGWDNLRETTFKRQKEMGWIPANAQLTPRDKSMASWDSIPESQRPFQERLMEVFTPALASTPMSRPEKSLTSSTVLKLRDNTIIFYISNT